VPVRPAATRLTTKCPESVPAGPPVSPPRVDVSEAERPPVRAARFFGSRCSARDAREHGTFRTSSCHGCAGVDRPRTERSSYGTGLAASRTGAGAKSSACSPRTDPRGGDAGGHHYSGVAVLIPSRSAPLLASCASRRPAQERNPGPAAKAGHPRCGSRPRDTIAQTRTLAAPGAMPQPSLRTGSFAPLHILRRAAAAFPRTRGNKGLHVPSSRSAPPGARSCIGR
jgi:hypothetical protein